MSEASTAQWVTLGSEAEFPEGRPVVAEARGWKLLVLRGVDGDGARVSVVENRCTHAATRLDTGRIKGSIVACPLHGARFDLRDGSVQKGPATRPLPTFPARLEAGRVLVELPPRPAPVRPPPGVFR